MHASPAYRRIALSLQRIILTFWVGGTWTVGYVVAPSLFQQLENRQLAGQLAGHLFSVMGWLGLLCSVCLLVIYWYVASARWRYMVLLSIAMLIAINMFILAPDIAALRESVQGSIVQGSEDYKRFAMLHGIASGMFLLVSLLGLLLVIRPPVEDP